MKGIYGLMAEFESVKDLMEAARRTRDAGYKRIDAYSPFPIHGLEEALGHTPSRLPLLVLMGGVAGCLGGYFLQYYTSVIDYPLNIGGRPLHSWPMFIPITFETTVLAAVLTTVLGMLALNGLPTPYHPVFNLPRFAFASRDRFFLCIESKDAKFDKDKTKEFLLGLKPKEVNEVPH